MLDTLLVAALLITALTLLAPEPKHAKSDFGWTDKFPYAVFVVAVAFSPLLGGHLAVASGLELTFESALAFAWVGVASALPLSLLAERLFGSESYESYWSYLLAFRRSTKRSLVKLMVFVSIAVLMLGLFLLLAS